MKKIVIINGPSKQDNLLMACLRILFPECDIQVQSQGIESAEAVHTVLEPDPSKSHYQRQALEFLIHEQ